MTHPQNLLIDQEKTSVIAEKIAESKQGEMMGNKVKNPEVKIWGHDWFIHKMEPKRLTFFDDPEETIEIRIGSGDYLQFNNQKIWTDEERKEKIKQVQVGDKCLERSEIEAQEHFYLGKTYAFSFDFFIPVDFPIIDNRLVLGQWKQAFEEGTYNNPIIAQRFRNGKYTISFNADGDPKGKGGNINVCEIDAQEMLGKWTHAEYQIKFSEQEDGHISIQHNGKLLWEHSGKVSSSSKDFPVGSYYKDYFFFKFGLYRDSYAKRLVELESKEDTPENQQKIQALKEAMDEELDGKLMTILFKNYKVEEIG